MIVKVCGMREADNIRDVDENDGVSWIGFIFFNGSSRYVDSRPDFLPVKSKRVGVFVNETYSNIVKKVKEYCLDFVQLHGDETPAYCSELRESLPSDTCLIKTIHIENEDDIKVTVGYESIVDYFLFETKSSLYGGSGMKFNWSVLNKYIGKTPFLLTGGIGPEDSESVRGFRHPLFYGVDLNSRFETKPALKNVELIKEFVKKVMI